MSLPPPLAVDSFAARRFMRRTLLIDQPAGDLGTAIDHHGYIQIDPINVCGRMHDLILRNRVAGYREGDLTRHLHGIERTLGSEERIAFEHHLPSTGILVAFALDAWPHLLTAMNRRTRLTSAWSGKLTPREKALADRILAEVTERGPLSSDAIDDGRKSHRSVWGSATLVKSTMQKLYFHGRLLIAARQNGRRKYDLPERVLPARYLSLPPAPAGETSRWLAHMHLRQRRLVALKRADLALVEDLVQPVKVGDGPMLYCLRSDVQWWSANSPMGGFDDGRAGRSGDSGQNAVGASAPGGRAPPKLLAPLDPLIYDRKVTKQVWGYDYTWEVYVPAAKRKRGYYAMPLLAALELAGHVDSKADRPAGRLRVVSRQVKRGHKFQPAFKELASFLGLKP